MVEVIAGPPKDKWSTTISCKNCRAKLKATTADIHKDSQDPREPTWYYIVCPLCQTFNSVKPPAGF